MFNSILNFLKGRRLDGRVIEELGEVAGVAFGDERIAVQVFEKKLFSDKSLTRIVFRSRHSGGYRTWAIDLTDSEARKLTQLVQRAIDIDIRR